MLVHSPNVLESKWHHNVAERSERGDERGRKLVGLFHHDLMVPGVCIKELEGFTPQGRVDYLIYTWQRKWILWTRLVETHVVNTLSPFPALLSKKG